MADEWSATPNAGILNPKTLEEKGGSSYPTHLSEKLERRFRRGLGNRLGICNFGVNLLRLAPGAWS